MELVFVALRGGAAFEVAHVGVVVGHNERALKLACARGVDAEIGGQLHRAAYSLGNIDKRAVGEHRRVEGGIEIVAVRHHFAQVFPDQFGIVLHGFGYGAEDDAEFGEFLLMGGLDADGVHHGIDGHARELFLLLEGYAEAVEGVDELGVDLVEALRSLLGTRGGIVAYGLEVDGRYVEVGPVGFLHRQPVAVGLQAEFEEPFGFALLGRDHSHHILAQAAGYHISVDVGGEAVFIVAARHIVEHVALGLRGRGALRRFFLVHVPVTHIIYKSVVQ